MSRRKSRSERSARALWSGRDLPPAPAITRRRAIFRPAAGVVPTVVGCDQDARADQQRDFERRRQRDVGHRPQRGRASDAGPGRSWRTATLRDAPAQDGRSDHRPERGGRAAGGGQDDRGADRRRPETGEAAGGDAGHQPAHCRPAGRPERDPASTADSADRRGSHRPFAPSGYASE